MYEHTAQGKGIVVEWRPTTVVYAVSTGENVRWHPRMHVENNGVNRIMALTV